MELWTLHLPSWEEVGEKYEFLRTVLNNVLLAKYKTEEESKQRAEKDAGGIDEIALEGVKDLHISDWREFGRSILGLGPSNPCGD